MSGFIIPTTPKLPWWQRLRHAKGLTSGLIAAAAAAFAGLSWCSTDHQATIAQKALEFQQQQYSEQKRESARQLREQKQRYEAEAAQKAVEHTAELNAHANELKEARDRATSQFNAHQSINKKNLEAAQKVADSQERSTTEQAALNKALNRARLEVFHGRILSDISTQNPTQFRLDYNSVGMLVALNVQVTIGTYLRPLSQDSTLVSVDQFEYLPTIPKDELSNKFGDAVDVNLKAFPQELYDKVKFGSYTYYFIARFEYTDELSPDSHHLIWCGVYNKENPTGNFLISSYCPHQND